MQKYLIIVAIFTSLSCYTAFLKYDNKKLESEISNYQALNKGLELSLELEKSSVKILTEKQTRLLSELKELESRPIQTNTKYVKVDNCEIKISDLETSPSKAVGIPKHLGNIGR